MASRPAGVYAVTDGPLTREMMLAAALLYGGDHAMLSHRTAAEEWECSGSTTAPGACDGAVRKVLEAADGNRDAAGTGVRAPRHSARVAPASGCRGARSRAHRHIGVDTANPRTSKADTALDVAVAEPSARLAYVSLVTTVTNARIRLNDVRQRMVERRPRRYRRALEDAGRTPCERRAVGTRVSLCGGRRTGAWPPDGAPSEPVIVDGRTLFEDVDYSEHGVPLIVRLDGRWLISMREVQFRDRRRDNAAELADRPRLVYGMDEVAACRVSWPGVEAVLTREGWRRAGASRCRACAPFR